MNNVINTDIDLVHLKSQEYDDFNAQFLSDPVIKKRLSDEIQDAIVKTSGKELSEWKYLFPII